MFWADRIAKEVIARFGTSRPIVVRDEKTVSGRVHIGSMRGVAIHSVVDEALRDEGAQTLFKWEHNDFDPMDDLPPYIDHAVYEQHLGKPLYTVPSPDPAYKNFGEYFGMEFQKVIEEAGWHPQFYWASDLYLSGKMDDIIRDALINADTIRQIMKEVSGAERKPGWLPISVVCPTCGKMTTTDATDFDGETVQVNCYPTKVPYTKGCGFSGRVSPFGGKAKLYWKTDWPAKWKVNGVMVEGGGKDHSTKGGSRDVAKHISAQVYHYDEPFDIPYEFFLVGGKKMSSSKGRGSSAREISALVPTKILRLALLSKDINQAINFDQEGDTIPVLYDLYDKLAEGYKTIKDDDYARLFELIHPDKKISTMDFLPRFSQVAFMAQMPHMVFLDEMAKLKGSPLTDDENTEAKERAVYAMKWINQYAPDKFVFKLQDDMPDAAKQLSDTQKKALKALREYIQSSSDMPSGEDMHQFLHGLKESVPIEPAKLFSAVYLSFLAKSMGPKAGWFLSVLPREFVLRRLEEATQ